jgi:plastocyanin
MNNLKFLSTIFFLFTLVLQVNSTTWNVTASGRVFSPTPLTVSVGDTIKWQWVDGLHTTTSTSVPAGALTWDAPLDNSHPTFNYVITQAGTYNYQCTFHVTMGMVGVINANPNGIKQLGSSVPQSYNLMQNFPNPFNPSTNIRIDIPKASQVTVKIYDVRGNLVQTLINSELQAGSYSIDWNASEYSSGIYFYRLNAGDYSAVKKMVLMK